MLFAQFLANWGFLRILRLWGVVQSERFWNVLARGRFDDTQVEDLTKSGRFCKACGDRLTAPLRGGAPKARGVPPKPKSAEGS